MDSKTYIKNAIRTESIVPLPKVDNTFTFDAVLECFIASAQLLDMYKKNIYYGKPIDASKWGETTARLTREARTAYRQMPYDTQEHPLYVDSRILHAIIGIATESGELMEAIHESFITGKHDKINLQEEVGDLNWYQALLIDALDADWDEIRERNIAKLKARYPDKFDSDKAINRNTEIERKILEGETIPGYAGDPGDMDFGGSDFQA